MQRVERGDQLPSRWSALRLLLGKRRAKYALVNAAECEPMLKVDQQLMAQQASRLLRGVHYAMKATGASSGIGNIKYGLNIIDYHTDDNG